MSLLMKKRQLESLRNNGLNDTHAVKPQTMASQKSNGDSWETMGMQMKTPTTTYAEASHPEAMNHLQPQTTRSRSKQQEEAVTIESLLQQSFQQRGVGRSERKISTVPSWTVPTTAPMTNNEAMGYQVAVNNDYKLPEGAYYEEPPVFQLDAVVGKPMSFETPTPQQTEHSPAAAPIPKSAVDATFQLSRCSNANCPSCKQ